MSMAKTRFDGQVPFGRIATKRTARSERWAWVSRYRAKRGEYMPWRMVLEADSAVTNVS